jgi:hypothetical protein
MEMVVKGEWNRGFPFVLRQTGGEKRKRGIERRERRRRGRELVGGRGNYS